MPAVLVTIFKALGSALFTIAMKLATEKFAIAITLKLLEALVNSTKNELGKEIVEEVKKALEVK